MGVRRNEVVGTTEQDGNYVFNQSRIYFLKYDVAQKEPPTLDPAFDSHPIKDD